MSKTPEYSVWSDMKTRCYNSNAQLDRINNNGNYEPANCRWITPWQNCLNKG